MADTNDKGNFVAYMNRSKQAGDNKPAFDGRIAIPGTKTEHRMALWSHEYTDPKSGELRIALNGKAQANAFTDAPQDQIAALTRSDLETAEQGSLKLQAGQIVLFENNSKDEPSKSGKDRPDYYGYYNAGGGQPVIQIGAWARKDRYQNPMLSGATSYPLTDKTQDQEAASKELDKMIETGAVTKGSKTKGKSKSEGGMSR